MAAAAAVPVVGEGLEGDGGVMGEGKGDEADGGPLVGVAGGGDAGGGDSGGRKRKGGKKGKKGRR